MKPKMAKPVVAWAFVCDFPQIGRRLAIDEYRSNVLKDRRSAIALGYRVGPIVRIEVPAPVKARKGKK